MSFEVLVQLVMALGVIPALFVWLLTYTMNEHKKDKEESRKREEESRKREEALIEHMRKSDETQAGIMRSVEKISDNMIIMQRDIEVLKKGA
jgi:esterase/lipase